MRYIVLKKYHTLHFELLNLLRDPAPLTEFEVPAQSVILEPMNNAGLPPYSLYVGEEDNESPPDYRVIT